MGRPSKLDDRQWEEVKRRLSAGESVRALAREFKVGAATISERCSGKAERIKSAANKVFEADKALAALPVSERPLALRIADDLKATAANLARGARAASETYADLSELARKRKDQVVQGDGTLNLAAAMEANALTEVANKAATPALKMVMGNQEKASDEPTLEELVTGRKA